MLDTKKMASNSIAEEMMEIIESRKLKRIIPALPHRSGLSEHVFPKTLLANIFTLDVSCWIDRSFMNPSAMFELFRTFSDQTSLQVRQQLLKFLKITKKKGAEECALLNNAWIALHMHSLTPRQWADNILDKETPGDEIALFALCKQYHHHCVVLTSAKIWCTLDLPEHTSESDIYEMCDIKLLYIEPGVFGKLRPKPALPPAPLPQIIPENTMSITGGYKLNTDHAATSYMAPPLDLSSRNEQQTDTQPLDEDSNAVTVTKENETSQLLLGPTDAYVDAKLSGSLEKINFDFRDITFLKSSLNQPSDDVNTDTGVDSAPVNNTDMQQIDTVATGANIMKKCMVKLDRLSDITISKWQMHKVQSFKSNVEDSVEMPTNQVGPYGLRICPHVPRHTSRHDRTAKQNMNYQLASGSSQEDDDFDVKPG